jgi:hypothetical protein
MPRIKKIEHTPAYSNLRQVTSAHNERGDCAVKALSLLTGVPYDQMLRALNAAGRKPRSGTPWVAMERALGEFGFKLEKLEGWSERMIATYPGVHKNLQSVTTHHPRRFKKAWAGTENLLLDCSRHVAAFVNGQVHDHTVNNSMRVRNVYRIVCDVAQTAETAAEVAAVGEAAIEAVSLDQPKTPEEQGYADALRGHTSCPDPRFKDEWNKGYDRAVAAGLAEFPRFGTRGAR